MMWKLPVDEVNTISTRKREQQGVDYGSYTRPGYCKLDALIVFISSYNDEQA